MPEPSIVSPALAAAQKAEEQVTYCLSHRINFLLEAGAGAGKTFSLVEALKQVIRDHGLTLRRKCQQVACITYTNAAVNVITNRIDGNALVAVSTIHAFCWGLIKGFQPTLRNDLQTIEKWQSKLAEGIAVGKQTVEYDLGYRKITEDLISLDHDDVLTIAAKLLALPKFQSIVASRFPYIFIDEYQDTNAILMSAFKQHLMGRDGGPTIGLFGDHWQRIYENTCGHVTDPHLTEIGKKANFRSATSIVSVLNAMRSELPQAPKDEAFRGEAIVFQTNGWRGTRRSAERGGHWTGDLPPADAHKFLESCIAHLKEAGWDFSAEKTKILLLTHTGLAAEQGYSNLAKVFPFADHYIGKADDHIAFFADKLEPGCAAFLSHEYGKMFDIFGSEAAHLKSHDDKKKWSAAMNKLNELRQGGTIGEVMEHLLSVKYPRLPEKVFRREKDCREFQPVEGVETPSIVGRTKELHKVRYAEVIELVKYLDGYTPFTTKHSVKGDEFENVLVVLGRGWNKYNFDQYLKWASSPANIPADKAESYERNRNLFYVTCSRPTTRLALLFTQVLSAESVKVLNTWFGQENVIDVGSGQYPMRRHAETTVVAG